MDITTWIINRGKHRYPPCVFWMLCYLFDHTFDSHQEQLDWEALIGEVYARWLMPFPKAERAAITPSDVQDTMLDFDRMVNPLDVRQECSRCTDVRSIATSSCFCFCYSFDRQILIAVKEWQT